MNVTLKYSYLLIVVCEIIQINIVYGQWNRTDSVELQSIVSSEDSVRLNPETLRAIESGTFILPEFSNRRLNSSSYELPLLMDFSEYIQLDTVIQLDIHSLPVGVFKLYQPEYKLMPELRSFYFYESDIEELRRVHPGGFKFNAESITRYLFWKSERAKVRNRKRANAWKYYNTYP